MSSATLCKVVRTAVIAVALCGIVIFGFIIPNLGADMAQAYPELSQWYLPWLIFLLAASVPCFVVLVLAWNYIKLLFEAAERYILLAVLVFTAPVAFAMGSSQTTSNIFKSWCRMLGGQIFLLIMNAWCLRLFTSMVGQFLANPLSL